MTSRGRLGLRGAPRFLFVLFLGIVLLEAAARPAAAGVVYLYDDLGRLVRVIRDDGEAASYHYDVVGNVLAITRESGVGQTTSITGTSRPTGEQGSTVPLTVSGTNLIGASVVCTTPGLTAQDVRTDFDQITLQLLIDQTAPTGLVQCEILGVTTVTLPFSVVRTIPVYMAAPAVSVVVTAPLAPFVAAGVSVQAASAGSEIVMDAVAVAFEPAVTIVSPATGAPATPSLAVRLLGAGLGDATAVSFLRNNAPDPDISVVTFSVSPDGTELDVEIAIAVGAPLGARVVRITTPTGASPADGTGGNLFTVR